MNARIIGTATLFFLSTPLYAAVTAEQSVEIEVAVRVADGDDRIERVKAENVKPGEGVIYSLHFSNEDKESADSVEFVMPVPVEVSYVENSAMGNDATITFSADGGQTFVMRGRLTVAENGENRPAKNSEITHIKWKLNSSLPAGMSGEASYRAVVN